MVGTSDVPFAATPTAPVAPGLLQPDHHDMAASESASSAGVENNTIATLLKRIEDLEAKLSQQEKKPEEKENVDKFAKPKPIDIKDVKKPEEYNGDATKFRVWFERFQDLLFHRAEAWGHIISSVENAVQNEFLKEHQNYFFNLVFTSTGEPTYTN